MNRRSLLASAAAAFGLTGCAALTQTAATPGPDFTGPGLEDDWVVSFDGARLGLSRWLPDGEPWAVIVGVHGINDYSGAFRLAGPWWAARGIATYAYDQRGFGRSPQRGIWAGDALMTEDLRTVTALVRARYPRAVIAVAGESLGGAVTTLAFASDRPPAADRAVLVSAAVWGWSTQPLPYKTVLWLTARAAPGEVIKPPDFVTRRVRPTDNVEMLRLLAADPLMVWGARADVLYGLVDTMERAYQQMGAIRAPVLDLYGRHDSLVPPRPAMEAAARLKPTDRTAYYADGYHLLLVDYQAERVWADVVSFIRDPAAPLPSGAPPIPRPS